MRTATQRLDITYIHREKYVFIFAYRAIVFAGVAKITRKIGRYPQMVAVDRLIAPIRSRSDLSGNRIGNIIRVWSFSVKKKSKNTTVQSRKKRKSAID